MLQFLDDVDKYDILEKTLDQLLIPPCSDTNIKIGDR
jgi:hypothetical protein